MTEARRRYLNSEKGKATVAAYLASAQGKAVRKKINASPNSRAAIKRWQSTPKGKASAKRTRKRSGYDSSPRGKLQHWRWAINRRYKITEAEYHAMFEKQNGVCAICERPPKKKRLHVDHDHVTNKVRGLLCDTCNRVLGMMNDDPRRFVRAAEYLLKTQGGPSPN